MRKHRQSSRASHNEETESVTSQAAPHFWPRGGVSRRVPVRNDFPVFSSFSIPYCSVGPFGLPSFEPKNGRKKGGGLGVTGKPKNRTEVAVKSTKILGLELRDAARGLPESEAVP